MHLILPKTLVADGNIKYPLFFLAGPIQGGGGWQERACHILKKSLPTATIAVPCRWTADHPLFHYRLGGDEHHFVRQTLWERYHLARAARHGCILFWLPCESGSAPRLDGQPYARDTYGELGEWRARLMTAPGARVVVGAEAGFPGLDVISCNFDAAIGCPFPIYPTLEETVEAAVRRS